jgi:hypothetical protein
MGREKSRRPASRLARVLLAACVSIAGCGDRGPMTPEQLDVAKLNDVAEILRVFQISKGRPPQSIKELSDPRFSNLQGYEAIRSGQVVVLWGATLPETGEEPTGATSDEVLAYLNPVPDSGGPVLMRDRRVRTLTAEEFRASPKAGSPEPEPSKRKS